jgi:hypothetical protein
VAGHGGKQNADEKERGKDNAGFGGEMKVSAAGWHDNSPQLIVRIGRPRDFRAWYRKCAVKNWSPGQENEVEDAEEVKEVTERTRNLQPDCVGGETKISAC